MKINRLLLVLVFLIVPTILRADGIDLYAYFTRVGTATSHGRFSSPLITLAAILLLMAVNYALNWIFIGLPAVRFGKISNAKMAKDLFWLTLWGQAADRVGALLALLFMMIPGVGAGMTRSLLVLLGFNLIFPGIAIAALVAFFCRKFWHLSPKQTVITALLAAIFTNPAYLIVLGFFL